MRPGIYLKPEPDVKDVPRNNFSIMYKKILKYLLLAAIFTPLIKFSYTVFPFVFAKAIFFQILVSIAFCLYIFLLCKGEIGWPKKSWFFWAIALFISTITIASLFGVDFIRSFWDTEERMTGIFNLLYYAVFFTMLVSVFETKEDGRQLAASFWVMGTLLMLSGYAQVIKPDFWGYEARSRIAGLLNNPIFYAMAMSVQVFLSLFLAAETPNKNKKVLYTLGGIAAFYAIFLSQTRGAVIGVTAGLIVFGLMSVLIIKDKKRKLTILAMIGLFCVLIGILWLKKDTPFVRQLPISYYLNISPFAGTGATRLLAWQAAWSGFLERPFFGWGLNNFNIIFNQFYNPESLRYTAYETWFDRTHNVTLEFLATTGLFGLSAYLLLFITSGMIAIKAIRRGENSRPILLLVASLVAYFIQNQFALDQPTSLLLFFGILALISIYGESREKLIKINISAGKIFIPMAVALAIIFSIYRLNIIPLYAGYLNVVGVSTNAIDYKFSAGKLKKALTISHPYRYDSMIEFTQGVIRASISEKITDKNRNDEFTLAEREMKNLIFSHPLQTYYHYLLGRLYSEWGRYDTKYFTLGEAAFRAAEKLSPRRQQIFFGLGEMYLFAKEYDRAEATFRHLVDLEPRVGEAHWYLGLTLGELDKNKEATAEFYLAYQYGYIPQTQEELNFFVDLFEEQKRYYDIAVIYDRYTGDREPTNSELFAKEAAAWFAAGEYEKARAAVLAAVGYDPKLQVEAEIFLKMIEAAEKNK